MTSSEASRLAGRTTMSSFCVLALVLLSPTSAFAERTAQDIESARQLFNQGIELRDKGDLKGALEKLRAAHALGNTPITGIELCRTHAALRQPVEAREVCLGVARIPLTTQETARSQDARTEAGRIAEAERSKIGSLRIKVTGVPAGREPTVLVDNATVPAAALGEPRAVNPGGHVVLAKVGSGGETRASVDVREGETKEIELGVQAPPPESTPPPDPHEKPSAPVDIPRGSSRSVLPIVFFTVAGVAGLIGAVTGLKAASDESDLKDRCVAKKCGIELHDDLDAAKRWGNVSTASFVVGGVSLVAGLVATLIIPSPSSTKKGLAAPERRARLSVVPVVGLGGAGLDGTF